MHHAFWVALVLFSEVAVLTCASSISSLNASCEDGRCQSNSINDEVTAMMMVGMRQQSRLKSKMHGWSSGSIPQRVALDPLLIHKSLSLLGVQDEGLTSRSEEIADLLQQREDMKLATNPDGADADSDANGAISSPSSSSSSTSSSSSSSKKTWLNGFGAKGGESNVKDRTLVLAGGATFAAMGSILGKFMSNQKVSKGDWINLAQSAVVSSLNVVITVVSNMVSSLVSGFLGLLGSFFGALIRAIFALFMPKEPSVGELINSALAKERMRENKDFWMGLADEVDSLASLFTNQHESDVRTAWYLILQHDLAVNRQKVFLGECLDSATWGKDTCTKYIKDGMWEVMLPYAQMHMEVLWELVVQFMESPTVDIAIRKDQVETLIYRMKDLGKDYAAALRNAWKIYYKWRMSVIWNPFSTEGVGMDVMKEKDNIYHPFDFLHANKDQGYDKLDLKFPVKDRSDDQSYYKDVQDVRGWGYKGCYGERHKEVTKEKDPKEPNHACNLFHEITSSEGCGCARGDDGGKWFQNGLSDEDKKCWSDCMAKYTKDQENDVKKAFLKQVEEFEDFVQTLSFPETYKSTFQTVGTQCSDNSRFVASKCEDAFKAIGQSYSAVEKVSDGNLPAGCSLKLDGDTLIANDIAAGKGAEGYKPLCGTVLFVRQ